MSEQAENKLQELINVLRGHEMRIDYNFNAMLQISMLLEYLYEALSKKGIEIDMTEFEQFQKERIEEIDQTHKKMSEDPETKAKIMETPMGNIARGLLDGGANLGVSSRALGSLQMNKEGVNVVQDDFMLSTAADIVADPSAPDAFVRGIMESVEWVFVDGKFELINPASIDVTNTYFTCF